MAVDRPSMAGGVMFMLLLSVAIGCDAASSAELSDFMTSLWHSDVNNASSVRVNLQGHASSGSATDHATGPLFSSVNDQYYFSRPTYAALIQLLDNYNHVIGDAERSNQNEDHEVTLFLEAISKTTVMQKTQQFLKQQGYVGVSLAEFDTLLRQIWFEFYPRHGQTRDSCGFEHVFVGETDTSEVIGFHNWIQFHLQEQKGNLDYRGYIFSKQPRTLGTQFTWLSKTKSLGSFMYGTSPELDMAMFTVCYLTRRNQLCSFSVDGHPIQLKTFDITNGGGHHLGTAYVN
ncbi:uridylate-specific endoribonuclease D-like [Dreissena polymorpha]|uniref:uridylate-specific endoribonuclease D-like n=1 Tax=Dreissena polymorpha TaxID=45954 RepID=UPI0022653B18|nr:uridylate-specific endoribonuclease D-like [Dreissena polymorpha]